LIEGVSRERWRRALASLVGYVGDFDLAEESTQKAFAITLRLPATISRRVFPAAQVGADRTSRTSRPACPASRSRAGP
jgi:predicted RNA polymerase sigma factor